MDKNPTLSLKSGVFWIKKYSAVFLKHGSWLVYRKVIHDILAKKINFFLSGQKSNLSDQNRGYFVKKNIPEIS